MIASRIEVAVYDGPQLVERWPCTRTTLQGGVPGVVWRGVAYPLLPDQRIDVAAPAAAIPTPYTLIEGEEAIWVLISGTTDRLRAVEGALVQYGVTPQRSGRWLGEPVEEVAYDWFLRLTGGIPRDLVAEALGTPQIAGRGNAAETRNLILEQRIAGLLAEVATLQQAVERGPAPPKMTAPLVMEPVDISPPGLAETLQAFGETQKELNEAQAELDRLRLNRASPKLQDELGQAFAALRPDIVLLRDSLTVVLGEYRSRSGVYRAVGELPASGARPDGWKSLRGAERWWERHVPTGQDDTGRAYARFDTVGRRWSVLLSWKGDQPNDVDWLQRQ